MIVSVAMSSQAARNVERRVCIVLDVLRASSTMLAMFEAGAEEIVLAETPEAALALAEGKRDSFWVCGERGGLKVDGFDYGNSPNELMEADLGARCVLFVSSNGTKALEAVSAAPLVLVGSPRNEVAVVRQAIREAQQRECGVLIVCAGEGGGARVALEDTFCAGMLVDRLLKLSVRRVHPEDDDGATGTIALDDSAIVAHRLYLSFAKAGSGAITSETIHSMLGEGRSGRFLPAHGYSADLAYCAEIDVTTVVPRLEVRPEVLAVVAQA